MKCNNEIRDEAKHNGILLWELAGEIGVADTTFSRWLRVELTEHQKEKIQKLLKFSFQKRMERFFLRKTVESKYPLNLFLKKHNQK